MSTGIHHAGQIAGMNRFRELIAMERVVTPRARWYALALECQRVAYECTEGAGREIWWALAKGARSVAVPMQQRRRPAR